MSLATIARVIGLTYAALLLAWLGTLPLAKRMFARQPLINIPSPAPETQRICASSLRSAGVLSVFMANIATIAMLSVGAFSKQAESILAGARVRLPIEVNILGAIVFILYGVWGTLVLVFNPSYAPFVLQPKAAIRIATKGPYAMVRHPRYVAEALLNVILFLFTGFWFPLLGIIGWPAMVRQAAAEERFLAAVAPEVYSRYAASTPAFIPRPMPGHRD